MQQKWNEGLCNKSASINGKFFAVLRILQLRKQGTGNGKWESESVAWAETRRLGACSNLVYKPGMTHDLQ